MDFYLARGGERSGPYSLERVESLLSQGLLEGDELAWHEGQTGWTAVREILNDLPTPVTAATPPIATQVPSRQTREERVTQKVPKSLGDKLDLIILPYFAVFCVAIITGLISLVGYLIWNAFR